MAASHIAIYIDTPETLEFVSYFNPKIIEHDFIVDLYKNYVVIDLVSREFKITGRKGLTKKHTLSSVTIPAYVLTPIEEED